MDTIYDLRTALSFLQNEGEEVCEVKDAFSPKYELAAYYARNNAGVPSCGRGGAEKTILFSNVKNHSIPVLMGLFGSRQRNNLLLNPKKDVSRRQLLEAATRRLPPRKTSNPLCQRNVISRNISLSGQLPILTLTENDAGPYITLGVVYAIDPETSKKNISIHRLCVQADNTLSIWMSPGRHLRAFYDNALKRNTSLPVSINIGVDPAIYFSSCFSEPLVRKGENELEIAGAIRGNAVRISDCTTVRAECISDAEIVLEGEITPTLKDENQRDSKGSSMPEFLGYSGASKEAIPIVKIHAITHRDNPIYQAVLGPGKEQSELLAIPSEISAIKLIQERLPILILDAHYSAAGGGQLLLILQVKKMSSRDDVITRQCGILMLSSFYMLKHVIIVDDDVNIHSHEDIMWALTTRFQADIDTIILEKQPGFPMDPSQSPDYSKTISQIGTTAKVVFDCTIPWEGKDRFKRAFGNYPGPLT